MEVPVLLMVFNRPQTTAAVFQQIRKAKPKRLFVAADGPRKDHPTDRERCRQVRAIVSEVDWDCQVQTLFRAENLGCGKAVSTAIDWFFHQVAEGIILEDDTLPNRSFFRFMEEMLRYYREDPSVMHITGSNFQYGRRFGKASYYFSAITHIWGWATWRRAWQHYDFTMSGFDEFVESRKIDHYLKKGYAHYWLNMLRHTREGKVDTWDYQWQFAVWNQGGLTIIPNSNMISNIGFGSDATHTPDKDSIDANIKAIELDFPLVHASKEILHQADVRFHEIRFNGTHNEKVLLFRRFKQALSSRLKKTGLWD